MVERVWGDGDPPLTPTVEGSMGEIKKYISSPKPMQDYRPMYIISYIKSG
ncbi:MULTISPECIES: hypothetical protein [Okeania]|nr:MULTISPECIES: hypothetical protein [Okeania]NEP04981.1 hypothetical protein [Okeania sp. SIO4D6]NET76702.1 hypothetical protein [Okeania sp. SIO1F9]NEP72235.1 hypothetical protein [Okeania sp. SIO2G5]NEP92247.1 hypothetical protein [Okeania sp. SIO2F5]NEQ90515.1 hypothetical protein [Okeania sp. SIO2G4]